MLHKLSIYLTNKLLNGETIDEDDYEIYIYGWSMLLSTAASVIAVLILALIFGQFIGTLLFMICFLSLRAYAGGYHANSYLGCFLTMIGIYLAALLIQLKTPQVYLTIIITFLLLISTVVIFIRAPQDHPNRPIEGEERVIFTRRSRFIIVSQVIIICGLLYLNYFLQYLWWATIGIVFASLSLLLSNWRNITN